MKKPPPSHARSVLLVCESLAQRHPALGHRWGGLLEHLARRGVPVHVVAVGGAGDESVLDGVHAVSRTGIATAIVEARRVVRAVRPSAIICHGGSLAPHIVAVLGAMGSGIPLFVDTTGLPAYRSGAEAPSGSAFRRAFESALQSLLLRRANVLLADTDETAAAVLEDHAQDHVVVIPEGTDPEVIALAPPVSQPWTVSCIVDHDGLAVDSVLAASRLFMDRYPHAAEGFEVNLICPRTERLRRELLERITRLKLDPYVHLFALDDADASVRLRRAALVVIVGDAKNRSVSPWLPTAVALGLPVVVCANAESALGREAKRRSVAQLEPMDAEGLSQAFARSLPSGSPVQTDRPDFPRDACGGDALFALIDETVTRESHVASSPFTASPLAYELEGAPIRNWMWLADPDRWDRALELGTSAAPIRDALAARFARVDSVNLPEVLKAAALGEQHDRAVLPFADETFDCVTMYGSIRSANASGDIDIGLVRECHRILRRGGCLLVAGFNAAHAVSPVTGASHGGAYRPSAVAKALRLAGFSREQGYYVTPSHLLPRNIVPMTKDAVRQFEALSADNTPRGRLRRIASAVGLQDRLFASIAFVAHR